jgi:hypothetical protein
MQDLTPAFEKIFIGSVLNQRVLETVVGVRRQALDQQNVGFGEPFQSGLQGCAFHPGDIAQEAIGEAASDHRADLRHLTRRAEPVEPRHQRLLQSRRDGLDAAASLAALQKEPRHFLDE